MLFTNSKIFIILKEGQNIVLKTIIMLSLHGVSFNFKTFFCSSFLLDDLPCLYCLGAIS
jgi:hypothetical protein